MNRIAYTSFIAFIAVILTLFAVSALTSESGSSDGDENVISLSELEAHDSADSCWKAIGGRVYDITDYIPNHPTPESVITDWCGQESTEAWEDIRGGSGHSATAAAMLRNYQIGVLEGAELSEQPEAEAEQTTTTQQRATERPTMDLPAGQFIDGSYYAELEPDGRGWIALAEVTVKQGRIIGVHYDEVQRDDEGAVTNSKLGNYGYAHNWRNASGISQLSAFPAYGHQLLTRGTPDDVDAITGATSAFDSFVEVVSIALADAVAEESQQAGTASPEGGYTDGSYYAELEPDSRGWISLIEITVKDGMILGAHYNEVQRDDDGNVTNDKLSDYGYAGRWRNVSGVSQLSAFPSYVRQLLESGTPEGVDGLSGATSSYEAFIEAAEAALEDAR